MYNTIITCTLDIWHNGTTVAVIELCQSTNASRFENAQINFVSPYGWRKYVSSMVLLCDKVQLILLIKF